MWKHYGATLPNFRPCQDAYNTANCTPARPAVQGRPVREGPNTSERTARSGKGVHRRLTPQTEDRSTATEKYLKRTYTRAANQHVRTLDNTKAPIVYLIMLQRIGRTSIIRDSGFALGCLSHSQSSQPTAPELNLRDGPPPIFRFTLSGGAISIAKRSQTRFLHVRPAEGAKRTSASKACIT